MALRTAMATVVTTLLSAIVVSSCDGEAAKRAEVEALVRATLRDPESAKFGEDMRLTRGAKSTVACGTLNAKNAFGGYIGYTPFMYYQARVQIADESNTQQVALCCSFVSDKVAQGQAPWDDPSWGKNCAGITNAGFDYTVKG